MIKGVNKKVLEINNPQSLYFEKAVLYLKPNMTNIPYKLAWGSGAYKKLKPQAAEIRGISEGVANNRRRSCRRRGSLACFFGFREIMLKSP